jgi:transcriptional regulator with XRE-family HTH domain
VAEKTQVPDVGARIREARIAMGISQTDLADRLGQGERTIQAWERNERTPRLAALTDLAEASGRTVAWFYAHGDDEEQAA